MKHILYELLEMLHCILFYVALTLFGAFFCVSNTEIAEKVLSVPGLLLVILWGIIGIIIISMFICEVIRLKKNTQSD